MLNLQREIIQVVEATATPLDYLNLFIETFQTTVVDRMITVIEQAVGVMMERSGAGLFHVSQTKTLRFPQQRRS